MSLVIAFILLVGLVALAALVRELNHVIRSDGYGHRPAPRSRSDDREERAVTFTRLAR
jgi:hypothetical protein